MRPGCVTVGWGLAAALLAGVAGTPGRAEPLRVDFAAVEYFPNLKSKIGLFTNLINPGVEMTLPQVVALGPGLMCSNLEFDHALKWGDTPLPALVETPGAPPLPAPAPSAWMQDWVRALGDADVAQMVQLTGAPAPWQVAREVQPADHRAPTDVGAAAAFTGAWTAAGHFAYPVLWTLWNEPGHALEEPRRGKDAAGQKLGPETAQAFRQRLVAARGLAAQEFAALYAAYDAALRPGIDPDAGFGFGSLLAADFNPAKTAASGRTFFVELLSDLARLAPPPAFDYLTFNSFNGRFSHVLSGTRAALAGRAAGPVFLTQYAPEVMKVNGDGVATKVAGRTDASPLQAATAMLDDLAQMERATDLQAACLSYWLGGDYGLLSLRQGRPSPQARYHVLRMFMDLPVLRTAVDFGGTGLEAAGLRALAGVNGTRAGVLFWNRGARALTVPLALAHLPAGSGPATVETLAEGQGAPVVGAFDGQALTVPAGGVALLRFAGPGDDPLARRKPMGAAQFLGALSRPDRLAAACGAGQALSGLNQCGTVSGTFGFYDAVRAVAYLGKGAGADPGVTARYRGLPARITVSLTLIGGGKLGVTADFDCGQRRDLALAGSGTAVLDLSGLPSSCRKGRAGLTLGLTGAAPGAQAEVYLTADPASPPAPLTGLALAPDLSLDEALVLKPFGAN